MEAWASARTLTQQQADHVLAIGAAEDREEEGPGLGIIVLRIIASIFLALIGVLAALVITVLLSKG
jgi:hypothetical protein